MQGTTGNISVAGMLRLLCNYGRTGRLIVRGEGKEGYIDIVKGMIAGAGHEKDSAAAGETVVELLLVLEEGSFFFEDQNDIKAMPGVSLQAEPLILESARRLSAAGRSVKDFIPSDNEVMKITRMPAGKLLNLSITDAEWNVLADFGGDTSVGAVIESSGLGREKAEAVIYGLVSAGLVRRTRFKIPEAERIAREEMGNIGMAIVDSSMMKLKIDRARMGMREMIMLLNEIEAGFTAIAGKTKAKAIIEKIWSSSK